MLDIQLLLFINDMFAAFQILQNFRLEYHGETMGMIHMPFTQPDKPLNIKFIPRED